MKVRLGYACSNITLKNVTTSSTYTYTLFRKEEDYQKLNRIIISNLQDLERIIDYNIKNNVHFYRISSKLIPLATLKDIEFDYTDKFKNYYKKISDKIKDSNMRVDFHLGEYSVLNSVREEVVENTFRDLEYHYNLLEILEIKDKVLILHVGSNAFGKDKSITRFINNYNKLDNRIKECIVIENDDKIFNIEDCIKISDKTGIRIVLDYHHYLCNGNNNLDEYIEKIFSLWDVPKIHFSSPKNNTKKEFRSHSDYIDCEKFIEFLEYLKKYNRDIDIMLEVKNKDEALFRLVRELKYHANYQFLDETTFIVE